MCTHDSVDRLYSGAKRAVAFAVSAKEFGIFSILDNTILKYKILNLGKSMKGENSLKYDGGRNPWVSGSCSDLSWHTATAHK